jgi:phosphatidylserine/phosphatidylglycerophosphate/cardiolipin synthase-like enzyme
MSIMPTLDRDPLSGLVAPPLIGSTGTMPLSIISLIPDIMRHYRDVIVRAEKEVFLVTNYWQPSNSVETIVKAMHELSDSVLKRTKNGEKPQKVVMKLIYDRGSVEQLWNSHVPVKPKDLVALKIPLPDDIPGIDLQVINFHRVLLGTFHAKFLIVDRKVALINR